MLKNFGKLCKKCSVNLIGTDSGELWLKKFRLDDIRGTGGYKGGYNIKILNGKKVLATHDCKNQ